MAPFKNREFIVKARDHFAYAHLGESLRAERMILIDSRKPYLERLKFFERFLKFENVGDHSITCFAAIAIQSGGIIHLHSA